jgi:hypothetical protein
MKDSTMIYLRDEDLARVGGGTYTEDMNEFMAVTGGGGYESRIGSGGAKYKGPVPPKAPPPPVVQRYQRIIRGGKATDILFAP